MEGVLMKVKKMGKKMCLERAVKMKKTGVPEVPTEQDVQVQLPDWLRQEQLPHQLPH